MSPKAPSLSRQSYTSSEWKGVLTTPEPRIPPDYLSNLRNGYLADPPNGSAAYARPGITLLNGGEPVETSGRWQCFHTHTNLDASTINFAVINGKLYRVNAQLTAFEDVTPVGITIDAGITTRVFALSMIGLLAFTDGVNRPWEATNLTSTPITGTYIDYDGVGGAWTAYAGPADYNGAPFMILNEVNGVARRADISWANPGNFAIGWQQPDFDNNWTLSTNDSGPLFALVGTNLALYYFRQASIGSASGVVGPDLASTATEDAIAFNVGTEAAQTVRKFGNTIYFCDAIGRPNSFSPGRAPEDIWKQMRGVVREQNTGFPIATSTVATAVIEPTLNLYIAAIWSLTPSIQDPPSDAFVFDAPTGTYLGPWSFDDDGSGGVGIERLGIFIDSAGRDTMVIGAEGGLLYSFNSLGAAPEFLTTESGVLLTTEGGVSLTTEGLPAVWSDNGHVPNFQVTPPPFQYSDDVNWNVDRIIVTTLNDAPISVTTKASQTIETFEGIPEPAPSMDEETWRTVIGSEVMGRGPTVTVGAVTSDQQLMVDGVTIKMVPSLSGPEDS